MLNPIEPIHTTVMLKSLITVLRSPSLETRRLGTAEIEDANVELLIRAARGSLRA